MGLKTFFKGGVHPPHKKLTANKPIEVVNVPKQVVIPLQQHIGKSAIAQVNKGDEVTEGQLIGMADGFISANVHSSVTGKVKDVIKNPTPLSARVDAVVIDVAEDFQPKKIESKPFNIEDYSKEDILKAVKDSGIVGMGGATFPTSVKLSPPPEKKIEDLIINGVECEPYLTADHRLMLEQSDGIIQGIKLLQKVLNPIHTYIGIENNKPDAIALLSEKTKNDASIEVAPLKVKYPQGAEKQLIGALTKKIVPPGKLPMDVGCVVQNVGTLFAIKEAVVDSRPLVERVVTISGGAVKNPGNYKVRIGTKLSDLLDAIGGLKEEPAKIISGGPMMGIAINSLDIPIMKGTSGVLFFSEKEAAQANYSDYSTCISCGRCVSACPMGLNPSLLSILGENELWADMKKADLLDCIECGSCNFSCPAHRPIVQLIKTAKIEIRKIQ